MAHFFFQTPKKRNTSPFIPRLVVCSIIAQLFHTKYCLSAIIGDAVWLGDNEHAIILKAFTYAANINRVYEKEQARFSGEEDSDAIISPQLSRTISALHSLSEDDLWKILTRFVHACIGHGVYIVIDGVESMSIEDQPRLLRNLQNLWSSIQETSRPNLKILITSLPQVRMKSLLSGAACIDEDAEYKGRKSLHWLYQALT